MTVRWVDTNKGDDEVPNCSRYAIPAEAKLEPSLASGEREKRHEKDEKIAGQVDRGKEQKRNPDREGKYATSILRMSLWQTFFA